MLINIYTANHGKHYGIEDHLVFLSTTFKTRGHDVEITETLDANAVNIIIDEFTNQIRNREIAEFRKLHPDTKIFFLLTEFIETRLLLRSFNFFGGLLDASVLAALNIYIRLFRKDFLRPDIGHWIVALVYSPLLLLQALLYRLRHPRDRKMKRFISDRIRPNAYLHLRYLGLEKMIGIADGVILAHEKIAPGLMKLAPNMRILGTIYPEIDANLIKKSIFSGKELFFEVTGTITSYRQHVIEKINMHILQLGIIHIFKMCSALSFSDRADPETPRGAYSLHPPQSRHWRYCSPTRIFRSLQYDNTMPVLTKVFHQHPIESLCLVYGRPEESLFMFYQYFKNPESLIHYLEPKMIEYMRIARKNNDALTDAMLL